MQQGELAAVAADVVPGARCLVVKAQGVQYGILPGGLALGQLRDLVGAFCDRSSRDAKSGADVGVYLICGLVFVNKTDLESKIGEIATPKKIIYGSTTEKKGIEELKETILEEFALEDLSQKDLTYLANTRQISLAKQAMQKIENVIEANKKDVPVDMLAIDIKSAWEDLGKIIGEYYEEELVDNIFQRFCLGK